MEVAELCVVVVGVLLQQPASVFARVSWVRGIATFPCWTLSPRSKCNELKCVHSLIGAGSECYCIGSSKR